MLITQVQKNKYGLFSHPKNPKKIHENRTIWEEKGDWIKEADEYEQSTLDTCVKVLYEIYHFVQLLYANQVYIQRGLY